MRALGLGLLLLAPPALGGPAAAPPPPPRNVLYIIVDDLTSNLELFGGEITQMVTPHLERLARRSVNFHRAYAQQAVCGPSRNSFLTGLYPDQTHVYTFTSSFRDEHPSAVTLPELFKRRGYLTCGFGKTFHDDRILSPPDYDMPWSWSDECPHYAPPQDFCGPGRHGWCTKEGFGEEDYTDGLGTTAALERLRNRTDIQRPFFFVVGLRKPHMDWALPQAFFDRQLPQHEIELPPASRRVTPEGMPAVAWWNCSVEGPWKKSMGELALFPKQPLDDDIEREILRAYYAAVSYTDHQVGRLLDQLEALGLAESTAVVFHSDHGFALSEEGMHCKRHTMEAGARVPLLVSVPWLMAEGEGRVERTIVELVDVYPTLASLLSTTTDQDSQGQGAEEGRLYGRDLTPLLLPSRGGQEGEGNEGLWQRVGVAEEDLTPLPDLRQGVAFSQYPRCRSRPDAPGGLHDQGYHWNRECCLDSNEAIDAMGFSVRVEGYRMTEWFKFDNQTWLPHWTHEGLLAVELYEQDRPPEQLGQPLRNLADQQDLAPLRHVLSRLLAQHFGALLWPKPGLCLSSGEEAAATTTVIQ